jgi:nucleoid DNA-binding protein
MKNDFLNQLIEALIGGEIVKTEMGLFWTERLKGWSGKNPKTGKTVNIPGKAMPFFLPSDDLSREVLEKSFLTAEEIWKGNFGKQKSIPNSTKKIPAGKTYDELVWKLRGNGEANLPKIGTFVVREWICDDSNKGTKKMITFSPDDSLREYLNPS